MELHLRVENRLACDINGWCAHIIMVKQAGVINLVSILSVDQQRVLYRVRGMRQPFAG